MSEQNDRYLRLESMRDAIFSGNDDRLELREATPDELTQLRTDLAKAKHDAANWQNIAEGMGAELRRLKETCEAQRKHVAALAAKLKAAGVRA